MVSEDSIVRVPIKIRKSIHKDFCNCWGIQVLSVDGVPQYINGDSFTGIVHLGDFLNAVSICLPIHFTYSNPSVDLLICKCINTGIPVTVKTNRVLPNEIVQALTKIPHSGIQVAMNYLDGGLRNHMDVGACNTAELREMLSYAKSWKIFTSLIVDYMPHLVSQLDLYEIVDSVKNYISHMLISFPDISDALYHEVKPKWEALMPSSIEKFRSYYVADVPTRTWKVKQNRKEEIVTTLSAFLKSKKITVEPVDHHLQHNGINRIRHISSGLSSLPLGIRPFVYEKDGEVFKEAESLEGFTCPNCGKPIFD